MEAVLPGSDVKCFYGPAFAEDDAKSKMLDFNLGGWLNLTPITESTVMPSVFEAAQQCQLQLKNVQVVPNTGYTLQTATAVVDAIEQLHAEGKPFYVSCASGNRASAAVALWVGQKHSWSALETFEWAKTAGMPWVDKQPFRDWISSCRVGSVILNSLPPGDEMLFRQYFEPVSSTYTYLLVDSKTREAVVIDPALDNLERVSKQMRELGVTLKLAINTHVHADHITGSGALKKMFPGVKSVLGSGNQSLGATADIFVHHEDKLEFGGHVLHVRSTPGHTGGCCSFVLHNAAGKSLCVFTGDTLLIRGCGRTDFQSGSSDKLFESIHSQLFTLPDATLVFPAHDYFGCMQSSILEEKLYNPRLGTGRTLEEFNAIMAGLNLPPPKALDTAVPANLKCGVF